MSFAMAAIVIGSAIYTGISSRNTSRNNARSSRQWAEYNSAMALQEAEYNANSQYQSALFNMGLSRGSAMLQMGAEVARAAKRSAESKYNAGLQMYIGEYNARLLEREEQLLWQQHDLNVHLYNKDIKRNTSTITSSFATSGIEVGNMGEAPEVAVLENETQGALQVFLMEKGADAEAKKLLEAAARTRWDTVVAANNILYQGASGVDTSIMAQQQLNEMGTLFNAQMTGDAIRFQGTLLSNRIMSEGMQDYNQYNRSGRQQFVNGLMRAGSSFASYYGSAYKPSHDSLISQYNTDVGFNAGF